MNFKYITIKNFFSKNECDDILKFSLENLKLDEAKVENDKLDYKVRKSKVSFCSYDNSFKYLKENTLKKIKEVVLVKGYEVSFTEHFQFTEYKEGDFYEWHQDSYGNDPLMRYCSIVLQLNDEYNGGLLQIKDNDKVINLESGKGNMFIFLSNMIHRVTPVESNVRYSLVNWFGLQKIENFKKTVL